MINFLIKLKFRSSFLKLKSFLLVFSMLIFFDSNAQVTFSITNASSVNEMISSCSFVNPGSGNIHFIGKI